MNSQLKLFLKYRWFIVDWAQGWLSPREKSKVFINSFKRKLFENDVISTFSFVLLCSFKGENNKQAFKHILHIQRTLLCPWYAIKKSLNFGIMPTDKCKSYFLFNCSLKWSHSACNAHNYSLCCLHKTYTAFTNYFLWFFCIITWKLVKVQKLSHFHSVSTIATICWVYWIFQPFIIK